MSYRPHPTKNRTQGIEVPKDWQGKVVGEIWWQFEVWLDGCKRSGGKRTTTPDRSVYKMTEQKAEIFHRSILAHNKDAPAAFSSNPKLKDIIADFLKWYKTEVTAETIEDFFVCSRHFLPFFGPYHLAQIKSNLQQAYKLQRLSETWLPGKTRQAPEDDTPEDAARRRPYTKRTINRELSYLASIIRWAEEENDPPLIEPGCIKIKLYKKEQTKRAEPIIPHTIDEAAKFLEAIGDESRYSRQHHKQMARDRYGLTLLMYHAGLRKKEARMIEGSRVNLPSRPIKLSSGNWYYGTINVTAKGGRVKTYPILTRMLYDELKERIKNTPGHLYVSPLTGRPYLDIRDGLKSAGKAAGIAKKNNPHLFRHDFITHLHETGADIKTISQLAGHSVLATTSEIYSHLTDNTLAERASGFADRVGKIVVTRSQQKKRISK